jgi:hypothetical protein
LLVSVLLGGCGGPSSYDDFRAQLAQVSCKRDVRCGVIGASEASQCALPQAALSLTQSGQEDVNAALKAGRLRFDSSGAQDCIDALDGAPCDQSALEERLTRRCNSVVHPNVGPGQPCFAAGECAGGYCQQTQFGCAGTCMAYPSPGAPCQLFGPPEMTCDPTSQYCGDPHPPDGGVPDGGMGGATVCIRQKQSGDACERDEECAFGLVCLGTCQGLPRLHQGDLCNAPGTLCDDGVYCDTTGHCVGQKQSGTPCDAPGSCLDKLTCVGFQPSPIPNTPPMAGGTCRAWLDVGASCNPGSTMQPPLITGCPSDMTCNANATCMPYVTTPRMGFHQPCSGAPCGDGLVCDGAICQFAVGQGGACKTSVECAPGLTCLSATCTFMVTCN